MVLERIGLLEGEMGNIVLRVDIMKSVSRAKRLVRGRISKQGRGGRLTGT